MGRRSSRRPIGLSRAESPGFLFVGGRGADYVYAHLPRGTDVNEFLGNGRPRGGRFSRHSRGIGSHDSYATGGRASSSSEDAGSTADHNLAFGAAYGVANGRRDGGGSTSPGKDFGAGDARGAADALGSMRPGHTLGSGGAARPRNSLRSFRSAGTLGARRACRSCFAALTLGSLGARGSLGAFHSLGTFRPLGAVVTLDAALSNGPLRSYRTLGSLGSRRSLGVSRRSLRTCFTPRASRSFRALFALGAWFTLFALGATGGSRRSGLTLRPRLAARALGSRVSPLTSFSGRTLGAGWTPVAGGALDSRVALGARRPLGAWLSLRPDRPGTGGNQKCSCDYKGHDRNPSAYPTHGHPTLSCSLGSYV